MTHTGHLPASPDHQGRRTAAASSSARTERSGSSALESALHGLRAAIASGEFAPASRLPAEAELCQRLKVSRSSLREAVRMLSALGVLVVRHGAGTYVADLRAADILSSLHLTVGLLPLEGLLEVCELRRVLEGHATAQAAARRADDLLPLLDKVLNDLEQAHDAALVVELDTRFHELVDDAAANPALTSLLRVFRMRGRSYPILEGTRAVEVKRASDRGHRAIYRALLARDPGAAEAAAVDHVAQTEAWLRMLQPPPDPLP